MKIKTSPEGSKNFEKPKIEEGLYSAKLIEVKDISDGQYGKRVSFIYRVSPSDTELALVCYVPEIATPENKFGKTLIAHGVDLGKEIETDALVGTEVRVMVEDYDYEEDKVKKTASSISKVKAALEEVPVEKVE